VPKTCATWPDAPLAVGCSAADADQIDEAYDRVVAGAVRFRFVIDVTTLARS
jgi:D-arabinose 1-dehydrogenase-like Zn-dependent alcohol dehydrogenase